MNTTTIVRDIIQQTKKQGDEALKKFTWQFDRVKIKNIKITPIQIKNAYTGVDRDIIEALKIAKKNITKFNRNILQKKEKIIETSCGIKCWREFRPIEKVGLYVPGGRAKYPSTVMMLGVPAKIAGCKKIIMCAPPPIPAVTLVAADLAGITEIYQVGGSQAIAAMAYGTKTIPAVNKIFGPGNKYVMEAKIQVSNQVAIDMPAGPSEIAVLADESAMPEFINADLKSQLEHGPDSIAILVTTSKKLATQIKKFPVKLVKNMNQGIDYINNLAPEHLEVIVKNEKKVLAKIYNAGSIFVGNYSPVPAGDYLSGPNHTLPTSQWAKSYQALSVEDFGKMIEFQKISKTGLKKVQKNIVCFAEAEGLIAHGDAIKIRFNK